MPKDAKDGREQAQQKPLKKQQQHKPQTERPRKFFRSWRPTLRHKECLACRKVGHLVSECCEVRSGEISLCFNCGDPGHTLKDCRAPRDPKGLRFARCFVCGELGHLSAQCPKNAHGMYPAGGCCRVCGSVFHKKQDCPIKNKRDREVAGLAQVEQPLAAPQSGDAEPEDAAETAAAAPPQSDRIAVEPGAQQTATTKTTKKKKQPRVVEFK